MAYLLQLLRQPLLITTLVLALLLAIQTYRISEYKEDVAELQTSLSLKEAIWKAEAEKYRAKEQEAKGRVDAILKRPRHTPPATIEGLNEWFGQSR